MIFHVKIRNNEKEVEKRNQNQMNIYRGTNIDYFFFNTFLIHDVQ